MWFYNFSAFEIQLFMCVIFWRLTLEKLKCIIFFLEAGKVFLNYI